MTTADLQALCEREMEKAKAKLSTRDGFEPYAVIVSQSGRELPIPLPASMMTGNRKRITYELLGATCRDIKAQALLLVGDAWALTIGDEQRQRMTDDKDYRERFLRQYNTVGCREMAAAGFGTLSSQVVCQAQTREHFVIVSQPYRMVDPDGFLIPATADPGETPYTVHFSEEPTTMTSEMGGQMEGILAVLYIGQGEAA